MTFYKENKALKADARESLLGHLTTAVISVFLYTLATSLIVELVANFQSGSVILSLVLSAVIFYVVSICSHMLRIGLASIFLQLLYQKKASIGDLFRAFHENSDTAVTISTFISLLELACMLPAIIALAVIPVNGLTPGLGLVILLLAAGAIGIIAVRIRYALVAYLFLDYPEYSAGELIRGSVRMIKGHKMRLLKLYLSFIPLYFLGVLSFGVAGMWVISYSKAAVAAFYRDIMAGIRAGSAEA